jgi:benzoyl-CoA reductase subunit D
MITAGIDVGAQTIKVIILKDGEVAARSMVMAGWDPVGPTEEAMDQANAQARLARSDIQNIVATGLGRKSVPFAQGHSSEVACTAKGAAWLRPSVRTVIDVGAEESRAAKCTATGQVMDFAKNDKCAAGVGAYVEAMARALEISIDEMAALSLASQQLVPLSATCVVFAESEVVSLIHAETPKSDIAHAINDAIAVRVRSMVQRVKVEPDVALVGGMAQNAGFLSCLQKHLGTAVWVPEHPQMVGALGAALIAAQ